jgi:hypothetical protein
MSKFQILKHTLALLVLGSFAQGARADGFVCDATHESLRIQVYNRTQPREGTRNVAVMVLSDPSKARGHRTLLRFEADNDGLTNDGARYTATLLPRISPFLNQQVQGIQLANLHEVSLKIDFSYHYPIGNEELVAGVLELTQVNGDQLWVDLDCTRYLKGSK